MGSQVELPQKNQDNSADAIFRAYSAYKDVKNYKDTPDTDVSSSSGVSMPVYGPQKPAGGGY